MLPVSSPWTATIAFSPKNSCARHNSRLRLTDRAVFHILPLADDDIEQYATDEVHLRLARYELTKLGAETLQQLGGHLVNTIKQMQIPFQISEIFARDLG